MKKRNGLIFASVLVVVFYVLACSMKFGEDSVLSAASFVYAGEMCIRDRDKNMPIYEVAERVGYRDYRHFSSTFKKLAGVGPKEFQMRS